METVSSQKHIFSGCVRTKCVTKLCIIHIGSSKDFLLFPHFEKPDNGVSTYIQLTTIFLDD